MAYCVSVILQQFSSSCILTPYFLVHCHLCFCRTLPGRLREALEKEEHDLNGRCTEF